MNRMGTTNKNNWFWNEVLEASPDEIYWTKVQLQQANYAEFLKAGLQRVMSDRTHLYSQLTSRTERRRKKQKQNQERSHEKEPTASCIMNDIMYSGLCCAPGNSGELGV